MRARIFLILPMILTPLLASCDGANQPVAAVRTVLNRSTPAARKAEIRRQLAPICPAPLSDDDLERAAQFIESNRTNGAAWIVRRLSKMDAETRVCRGS